MHIHTISETNDYYSERQSLIIDGKKYWSWRDLAGDAPEDATFSRDMLGAYDLKSMFKMGYEAGKNGVEVTYSDEEIDNS